MPNQDYQINVRQVTVGDALKQAGAEMDQVKQKATDLGDTSKKAAETASTSHEALGRKVASSSQIMQGSIKALKGDLSGLVDIGRGVAGGIGQSFGQLALKITAVGAAAVAGWQAGNLIYKRFVDDVKGLEPIAKKSVDAFKELDQVKLDNITKVVDALLEKMDQTVSRIERASRRQNAERDAAANAEIAKLEATMPEGPERDRAIAAVKARSERESQASAISESGQKREQYLLAKQDAESQLKKLEQDRAVATEKRDSALTRLGPSQGKGAMAQAVRAEYEASEQVFGPGIDKLKKQIEELREKITDEDSNVRVASRNIDASRYRNQATEATISAREEEDRRRALEADIRAKIQAKKAEEAKAMREEEDRRRALEADIRAKIQAKKAEEAKAMDAEDIEQTGLDVQASSARRRAESFKVDPRLRGKSRALAQSKDSELDVVAEAAAQNAADHKAAVKKMQAAYREQIDELVRLAQDMKTQNKRIGSGQ
jgi:hypothetical protein